MQALKNRIQKILFFNRLPQEQQEAIWRAIDEEAIYQSVRSKNERDSYIDDLSIEEFLEIKEYNERDRLFFNIEEMMNKYIRDDDDFKKARKELNEIVGWNSFSDMEYESCH